MPFFKVHVTIILFYRVVLKLFTDIYRVIFVKLFIF